MSDTPNLYRVCVHWRDPDLLSPTWTAHLTLDGAETHGQRMGCAAGTSKIEVFSPDGTLQAVWDKDSTEVRRAADPWWVDEETGIESYDTTRVSGLWQRVGAESQALGKASAAEISALLKEGLSTMEVAARLKARRVEEKP